MGRMSAATAPVERETAPAPEVQPRNPEEGFEQEDPRREIERRRNQGCKNSQEEQRRDRRDRDRRDRDRSRSRRRPDRCDSRERGRR